MQKQTKLERNITMETTCKQLHGFAPDPNFCQIGNLLVSLKTLFSVFFQTKLSAQINAILAILVRYFIASIGFLVSLFIALSI